MVTRLEITTRPDRQDSRGAELLKRIRSTRDVPVESIRSCEVYLIDADLTPGEQQSVLQEFVDPASQLGALGHIEGDAFDVALSIGYKPGVTDPVGRSALVAVADTLGRALEQGAAVYCSRLYLFKGVDKPQAESIAWELLANPVIQTVDVKTRSEWTASPPDLTPPKVQSHGMPGIATIELSGSDEDLLRISKDGLLALSLTEMHAIRDHFAAAEDDVHRQVLGLDGAPTDAELECLAQTWSEHCKHKIFNATITYHEDGAPPQTIRSLFNTYIRRGTEELHQRFEEAEGRSWLVSVFHDNAGVVTFDERMHLVYKVETHNSPSALDPYGGAMTGIVGVNRDPFGTGLGSDLLVNVWGYCFGSPFHTGPLPKGLLHPRRIREGVHLGVIDGGNQSGVPYGRGWERFDKRYVGKPLVFCGTVGSLPVTIAGGPGEEKAARPGDLIVMTGGRIGADGIHGATFSSTALDESSPVQAVQIGDPITQKRMFDFLLEARELGLYTAITDNGAGGLSSSVGEMAEKPGGARLDLTPAPVKYQGLAPWEILISEAQERMTLAVAPERIDELLALARKREVEATVLGEFTDDGYFHVLHKGQTAAYIPMAFMHDGDPDLDLTARWDRPTFAEPEHTSAADPGTLLLEMLKRLNLCSGEVQARHYDHEVKALSVVKPYIGVGRDVPSEATVFLAHHASLRGLVLSEGINPFYSDIDTYHMAMSVVDEAVRRQLCAGARLDRIALLDNFCWPDPVASAATPDGAYKLAQLVRACRGLYEVTKIYGTPLVSGKDSMKNESMLGGVKIAVPPTLLVSAIGQIDDVQDAITLELKLAGDVVFLVGETADETGGSEYFRYLGEAAGKLSEPGEPGPYVGNKVPQLDPERSLTLYRALEGATRAGLVRSAATPSIGGWGHTFARCAMAGGLGMALDLSGHGELAPDIFLFSESNSRFLITTSAENAGPFAERLAGLPCRRVGTVTDAPRLRVRSGEQSWIDLDLSALEQAFKETLQ
jgi:phosphoribosylformylglycinamidine synthase II